MESSREHWDRVYEGHAADRLSWYQARPERSLALIRAAASSSSASLIDVGGGASTLVDCLLDEGYGDLAVLDISASAIARCRARLGERATQVCWIATDVTRWKPDRCWDVWHDRAVFHFLTARDAQDAYISALEGATAPGAAVIMATFSLEGPERCSGLPVQRYSATTLAARLGPGFRLVDEAVERHVTPAGAVQSFIYASFRRSE